MTTGPNTPEGKAIVAANGLKHGLRSEKIVLPEVESEAEWEDFQSGILGALAPVGRLEEELALRVAQLQWRLRRAIRAEHDAVVATQLGLETDAGEESVRDGVMKYVVALNMAAEAVCQPAIELNLADTGLPPPSLPAHRPLTKIMRYEAQYSRQLFQTLHALQALQDKRNGKATPLVRVQWH